MTWLQQFATQLPALFALVVAVLSLVLLMAAYAVGMAVKKDGDRRQLVQTLARLGIAALLGLLLWHLGWLADAGLTRSGRWQSWLLTVPLLIYLTATALYAYTGKLRLAVPCVRSALPIVLSMLSIGLVEEVAYRGIVQYSLIRSWARSPQGAFAGVLVSALYFGLPHMIWALFGKPVSATGLQTASAFLGGIIYGAMVLHSGSLWPAVLLHGTVNAAVNLSIAGIPDFHETAEMGVRMILLQLPAVAYAGWLLLAR